MSGYFGSGEGYRRGVTGINGCAEGEVGPGGTGCDAGEAEGELGGVPVGAGGVGDEDVGKREYPEQGGRAVEGGAVGRVGV